MIVFFKILSKEESKQLTKELDRSVLKLKKFIFNIFVSIKL